MTWQVLVGDAAARLGDLPAASVQACVTSPPYWGLRDYGTVGQLGLESTPDAYVAALVAVFREVRRVLKDDGTLWLNLGDSYGVGKQGRDDEGPADIARRAWMVAFALRADGWYLRSDIIWSKPNPMPESVTDRPTKAHEYLFLLAKSQRYYYDAAAIEEPSAIENSTNGYHQQRRYSSGHQTSRPGGANRVDYGDLSMRAGLLTGKSPCVYCGGTGEAYDPPDQSNSVCQNCGGSGTVSKQTRNKRSVWTVTTQPYPDAHFATFPEALIEPCILAGSAIGDTVLDPFTGSGTTGVVAIRHQRNFLGCELNPAYVALARTRIGDVAPLLAQEVV
jgi:DNA modification methylase